MFHRTMTSCVAAAHARASSSSARVCLLLILATFTVASAVVLNPQVQADLGEDSPYWKDSRGVAFKHSVKYPEFLHSFALRCPVLTLDVLLPGKPHHD